MINAIAQLATVNARKRRIFNQSGTENTDSQKNTLDTRTLIDSRRYRANKSHTDCNYRSIQPLVNEITVNHLRMDNNNDENRNARQFRNERQIRYHWSADDDIMAIINSRGKSFETTEVVRRRTELARPKTMRLQWNRALGREIYVPRRPEEDERKEIKKFDIQLKIEKKIKSNHGSAADISETSATKYRKDRKHEREQKHRVDNIIEYRRSRDNTRTRSQPCNTCSGIPRQAPSRT